MTRARRGQDLSANLRAYQDRDKELLDLWGKTVRLRDGGRCQVCRKPGNQAHHLFSRRHFSTRYDLKNGICLCYFCHIRVAHEDPEIFRDFIIRRMGDTEFMKLKIRALTPGKPDQMFTFRELDSEYKRLFSENARGGRPNEKRIRLEKDGRRG